MYNTLISKQCAMPNNTTLPLVLENSKTHVTCVKENDFYRIFSRMIHEKEWFLERKFLVLDEN